MAKPTVFTVQFEGAETVKTVIDTLCDALTIAVLALESIGTEEAQQAIEEVGTKIQAIGVELEAP